MSGDNRITPMSPLGPIHQILINKSKIWPAVSLSLPLSEKMKNQERIVFLRRKAGFNDAEALALIFEDKGITDDGTLKGRLITLLDATEHILIPGLQTGIEFQDEGFRGDQNYGGTGFRDPHPSSRNQVGHFLTAVGLAFRPETVSRHVIGNRMRDWIQVPDSFSDRDVALRLTIGHELSPDPNVLETITRAVGEIPIQIDTVISQIWYAFHKQFFSAKNEDVAAFINALNELGTNLLLNMSAAEVVLRPIFSKIRVQERGNSYQDLRLSLAGWYLGEGILHGRFTSGIQVSEWVRKNLKK